MNQPQTHIYSEAQAYFALDQFPRKTLDELISLAKAAKLSGGNFKSLPKVTLPEGWAYQIFGNCIIARCQDGEQERKAFFVPEILIEFECVEKVEAKESVEKRLALGYCSCGRPIHFLQDLLSASDKIESKNWFRRALGHIQGFFLALRLKLNPVHMFSLQFNRHPDCL